MNKLKNLCQIIVGRAVICAVLAIVAGLAPLPVFAQTAEVKGVGVYYRDLYYDEEKDGEGNVTRPAYRPTKDRIYCNWGTDATSDPFNRSFVDTPSPKSNTVQTNKGAGDPWVSSALIEYDQPYPSTELSNDNHHYPNHCLALCMDVYCNNFPVGMSTYSISFPLQEVRFDIVKYYNGKNVENKDETPPVRTIDLFPSANSAELRHLNCGSYKCSNAGWHNSNNTVWGTCVGATYVAMYCGEGQQGAINAGYYPDGVYDADGNLTNYCPFDVSGGLGDDHKADRDWHWANGSYWNQCVVWDMGSQRYYCHKCYDGAEYSDCLYFLSDGARSFGDRPRSKDGWGSPIRYCAAWDGNYEHEGEMGKSNGYYAYRASVHTSTPGDGIIINGNIEFDSSIAYPGMNQIPIQVDVTNVHTVRSTPTMVGKLRVGAQPYTMTYRLSKDADVRAVVLDASTSDAAKYEQDNTGEFAASASAAADKIVRTLADWQPRYGEGIKGVEKDQYLQSFENWDGRNKDGLLLPAGNYLVAIQAKSQDEWGGIDFSRAVTRQLSLDPLVLTDVQVSGLNKKSTAYAMITYLPTEASNIYWEIYTPGTVFQGATNAGEGINTDSSTDSGTGPTVKKDSTNNYPTGSLVYRSTENRSERINYISRWDGTCQQDTCERYYSKNEKLSNGATCKSGTTGWIDDINGCKETFAKGSPLPDGNYVSVLWAEVPYNGAYKNSAGNNGGAPTFTAGGTCGSDENTKCFTGVKTLKYDVRTLEVERGLIGITIQPVSYSTIGSSPTAYGLDPFIFQYALDREAQVVASVQNTAGVKVRYLTPQEGVTNVAQQLNRLSWDGRDEQGRMVTPGTYMFVVEAHDAMFPSKTNRATAIFPVDMYRITDVTTTDVYGDSSARATISYLLSKAMNVQVNIYNKDVVIPSYNSTTGDYDSKTGSATNVSSLTAGNVSVTIDGKTYTNGVSLTVNQVKREVQGINALEWYPVPHSGSTTYDITLTVTPVAAWPPRVCNHATDSAVFSSATGYVVPSKVSTEAAHACIYVNDTSFTDYPATAAAAADTANLNVRLQPIETFERSALKSGDGMLVMEEWDALYFRNPKNCTSATDKTKCAYEMVPDGQYPFFVAARSNEPFDRYYAADGTPFTDASQVVQEPYLYATEKPVSKINVTRGPVYFLDGSVAVYPNAPEVFNASTGPTFIPPYEIDFSVSRASEVEIAIVALQDNVCSPAVSTTGGVNTGKDKNNVAGDVCKFLSTMTIVNTGKFDANIVRKTFWDGTDHNGNYVKPGIYEVRLTARNYPNNNLYEETVKSITVNADLFKVFDLLDVDSYSIAVRDTDMHIGYQISVPMKVAIQIFKPGTTIYDYAKGTLRNPTTGTEVKNINEVLVRSIVGIRPSMTLIDEIWDGRDYAHQEVPDGTYPFRFVTAIDSADIDSVTGEIIGNWDDTDGTTDSTKWKVNKVADTKEYQTLHKATIAIGDGRFVCSDWEKTVFFYPNPLNDASKGTLEITKMPVPGTMTLKFFNLAGDLVRDSDYTCVDANNYQVQMGSSLYFQPDNNVSGNKLADVGENSAFPNIRNAALRCRWDRTNQHGKKVARGVYFGLVDFKAQNGREHCQKVVKIIVP